MDKKEVAKILEQIGQILEIKGENPFKARAYYNAARVLETLEGNLEVLVESGEIADIKGFGKALSTKISNLVQTGRLPYYEELKTSLPNGLIDLLNIPGLGPKKVKIIYDKLNISTIGELEYACRENRLRDLEGFGQRSQDKILHSIELYKKYRERFLYPVAQAEANILIEYLRKNKKFTRIDITGSLRRRRETIKDIDLVASCLDKDRAELMDYYVHFTNSESIISLGKTKSSIILNSGLNSDLRIVSEEEYPFALHHFTGSREHNTAMRSLAKTMDMKMNEYGLYHNEKKIICKDETEIFKSLGLQYIPPELRENMGEIDAARKGEIPDLYDGDPLYGLFHIHTNYSDGANSIREIGEAGMEMGFQYIGICDHSKSAFYAHGLNEKRVLEQHDEINMFNSQFKNFKILKGIEVDILSDGTLDYSDSFLTKFDFVIASVHSNFNLDREKMTERIIHALKNPYVTMLGHPTGRLLLGREPYALDMEKVIEASGNLKKVIEINSSPYRLDLDWRWGKYAKSKGVKTALNPDAHSIDELSDYHYGIGIAKKGWFEKQDILNSYTATEIDYYFKEARVK